MQREQVTIPVALVLLWRALCSGSSNSHESKHSLANKIGDYFKYIKKHEKDGDNVFLY